MKRIFFAALVAALCAAPGLSRAELPSATSPSAPSPSAPSDAQARPASDGASQRAADEESEYAEREKAAPQLAEFSGGADGVYIGAGALVAVLLAVLIIAAL